MGSCPSCGQSFPEAAGTLATLSEAATHVAPSVGHGGGPAESGAFLPGFVLGGRYQVVRLLGRGGMGEVWQALDLKLRVDVALKRLRPEWVGNPQMLERLRGEARAARDVVSPNVCRIFDLIELDGDELVSMEFVDGTTLTRLIRERGPLEPREAMEIASQFLAGLEAIHQAGFVHRDVKPDNVMITRAGRVVVMDFGLARPQADDRTLTLAGTPAYMAPEQLRGHQARRRGPTCTPPGSCWRRWSARRGTRRRARRSCAGRARSRRGCRTARGGRSLLRAVAERREARWASARELMRALEQVALRVEGAEALRPYPGLASFTEADAEYFFGRELEVEALWHKLGQAHLLAVIGPSGAGKSSFLRAGLLPARPAGWRAVRCTPGTRPFAGLAHALADEFAGDADADARAAALRGAGGRARDAPPLARAPRRGALDRRPVRGAVHAQRRRRPAALRRAARPRGARGRRPRPDLAARRLPDPLSRPRRADPDLLRTDPPEAAGRRGPPPRDRPARAAVRLPLRGRGPGRRDDRRGLARAGRAPAAGLRRCPALGRARPRGRPADPRRLRRGSAASAARWRSTPRPPSSGSAPSTCRSSASCSATWSPRRAPAPSATTTSCSRSSATAAARPSRCSAA